MIYSYIGNVKLINVNKEDKMKNMVFILVAALIFSGCASLRSTLKRGPEIGLNSENEMVVYQTPINIDTLNIGMIWKKNLPERITLILEPYHSNLHIQNVVILKDNNHVSFAVKRGELEIDYSDFLELMSSNKITFKAEDENHNYHNATFGKNYKDIFNCKVAEFVKKIILLRNYEI
jgi:hypothetical protein